MVMNFAMNSHITFSGDEWLGEGYEVGILWNRDD